VAHDGEHRDGGGDGRGANGGDEATAATIIVRPVGVFRGWSISQLEKLCIGLGCSCGCVHVYKDQGLGMSWYCSFSQWWELVQAQQQAAASSSRRSSRQQAAGSRQQAKAVETRVHTYSSVVRKVVREVATDVM